MHKKQNILWRFVASLIAVVLLAPAMIVSASAATTSDDGEPAVIYITNNVVQPESDQPPDDYPPPTMVDLSGTAEDSFTPADRQPDADNYGWSYGTSMSDDPSVMRGAYPGDPVSTEGESQIVVDRFNLNTQVIDVTYVLTFDTSTPAGPEKPIKFAAEAADCVKGQELTPIVVSVTNPAENSEASGTTFPGVRVGAFNDKEPTKRDFYIRDIPDGQVGSVNLGVGSEELGMPDGKYRVRFKSLDGVTLLAVVTVTVDCVRTPPPVVDNPMTNKPRLSINMFGSDLARFKVLYHRINAKICADRPATVRLQSGGVTKRTVLLKDFFSGVNKSNIGKKIKCFDPKRLYPLGLHRMMLHRGSVIRRSVRVPVFNSRGKQIDKVTKWFSPFRVRG